MRSHNQVNRLAIPLALIICGLGMTYFFWEIANECPMFEQGTSNKQRPILSVLTSFWLAFGVYLVAWITVGGLHPRRKNPNTVVNKLNLSLVFLFGLVFRMIMTPTAPIQEIDLYRYVWDGAVFANGMDPYYFGPEKIYRALGEPGLVEQDPGIRPFLDLVDRRPGLEGILETIHYGKYTSPYPPVSQFFFGVAVSSVNRNAEPLSYIRAMKAVLVVFDVLTAVLVALLLYWVGMNPVLTLTYFWCPLVLKEISNGGHLDSIATFFTVLTVYAATRAVWPRATELDDEHNDSNAQRPKHSGVFSIVSALSLAAAFCAKVFPLVIFPIWLVVMLRTGWKAMIAVVVFILAAYCLSLPMLKHVSVARDYQLVSKSALKSAEGADQSGIEAFSRFWEMNDFLFMLVVENLKPDADQEFDMANTPWFRITSSSFRERTIRQIEPWFAPDDSVANKPVYRPSNYAFFATRIITLTVFVVIVIWASICLFSQRDAERWLEFVFLVLAWFWLLSPTQNPWYWTWALPFLVFARGRTWILLSGCVFAYYLRFWFEYQYKNVAVIKHWKSVYGDAWYYDWIFPASDRFPYQGSTFFDFYIPIWEFGPWFLMLAVAFGIRWIRSGRTLSD